MSMVPYQGSNPGSEMLRQLAFSKLNRSAADEAEQMSLVAMISTATTETLTQSKTRATEALAREVQIITDLDIDSALKQELLASTISANQQFSQLLYKIGDASASLIR